MLLRRKGVGKVGGAEEMSTEIEKTAARGT